MIGNYDQLVSAARGSFNKKDPTQPIKPVGDNSALSGAMTNRAQYGQSQTSLLNNAAIADAYARYTGGASGNMANAIAPGAALNPTQTYGNLIGSVTRSTGGLSSKGKYGGFNNAADLEAAIAGSAINFREGSINSLRTEADKYYGQLDTMRGDASRSAMRTLNTGVRAQMPSVDPNRTYQAGSYVDKYVNPLRTYANQLGTWYQQQAKPAEEYLQTAQQLENTPLSQLASTIATNQFGMNPDLASGKFQNLDSTYWKSKRDQEYVTRYGVPYDEYMAKQKEINTQVTQQQKDAAELAKTTLETATGFSAKALSGYTSMTSEQMNQHLAEPIVYTDPSTNKQLQANGAAAVQAVNQLITLGSTKDAQDLINAISAGVEGQPNSPGIVALLNALMQIGVAKQNKQTVAAAPYYTGEGN